MTAHMYWIARQILLFWQLPSAHSSQLWDSRWRQCYWVAQIDSIGVFKEFHIKLLIVHLAVISGYFCLMEAVLGRLSVAGTACCGSMRRAGGPWASQAYIQVNVIPSSSWT